MYVEERTLTAAEQEIIFRIRQLISDIKEVYVDDLIIDNSVQSIKISGTLYSLEEPRGYPQEIYINGTEYVTTSGAEGVSVLSYKYLRFNTPSTLSNGTNLTVIYDHFRNSDIEIIDTYDTSAITYLTSNCNLTIEELGVDLLVLATAFILLTKDIHKLSSEAIDIQDSDSQYKNAGATGGLRYLMDLLKLISDNLLKSLNAKLRCKMMSLPIYKVE